MDETTKKKFDSILAKDISAITEADMVFLRARSDYLTDEQKTKYMPIYVNKKSDNTRLIFDYSYKELQLKAKELGLKVKIGIKKEELIKLIQDSYIF